MKRILELSQDELGTALREYVQKHHPEQWTTGELRVVAWKDGYSTLTVDWTLESNPKKPAKAKP